MLFQTDRVFNNFINEYGCNMFSILFKVEKAGLFKKHFTADDINNIYTSAMQCGIVGKESYDSEGRPDNGCYVMDGAALFNLGARSLGINAECKSISWMDRMYIPGLGEEEILELGRSGYKGSHFVAGNGIVTPDHWNSEIEFDPIEGGSRCGKTGFIKSKRILLIKRKLLNDD
ncbi:Uncharacterised protein [uncultured archaeon]|nr:Uncharacterised protein [uncultured archaeon]